MSSGFLDAYEDQAQRQYRRMQFLKRTVVVVVAAAVVGSVLFFTLRTRSQEQVVKTFFDDLRQQRYQDAYQLWGCSQDNPCKYYPPEKFTEDWGPSSRYSNPSALQVEHVDYCTDGVVFDVRYPNSDDLGLWVQRSNNVISFAPWPRCPGRHLQLREFLRSLFS
jgi:hypothetical protein